MGNSITVYTNFENDDIDEQAVAELLQMFDEIDVPGNADYIAAEQAGLLELNQVLAVPVVPFTPALVNFAVQVFAEAVFTPPNLDIDETVDLDAVNQLLADLDIEQHFIRHGL